jgi:outer membrane lipoprotein LolB
VKPVVKVVGTAFVVATIFMAGCAVPARLDTTRQTEASPWRGRLAVRIESDPSQSQSQPQSFTAAFELNGNALAGELTLYMPLGGTAATLSWSPQTAVMRRHGDIRHFKSLEALIEQTVGTEIPVAALFAWLKGDNMTAAGWRADLSQHANGRITARRTEPPPQAELRLVFEK